MTIKIVVFAKCVSIKVGFDRFILRLPPSDENSFGKFEADGLSKCRHSIFSSVFHINLNKNTVLCYIVLVCTVNQLC